MSELLQRALDRGAMIYGSHDDATLKQILACLDSGAERFVECADGHLGYGHPIGGVAAYRDKISLSGVGYDIGCGNLAIRTDADAATVRENVDAIMDRVFKEVSFGVGRVNDTKVDHALFDDDAWKLPAISGLKDLARSQLGTVGSGNHYVDIFVDEEDKVWVGVHFGSRGFGHKVATHFLSVVGARDEMNAPPALLDAGSSAGADYLECMRLAGEYATAGREWVAELVAHDIINADITDRVHNHHNYSWRETHDGVEYHVARKGATPAFPGQLGFIGGSMGDDAVIVRGVDSAESKAALYSTVHGAGRVMSRTAARGKPAKAGKNGNPDRPAVPGAVSRDAMLAWIEIRGVTLRGADLDEAPQAYRRLHEVLAHHAGTIEVLHTLSPIGVAMAPSHVKDPYKD